MDQRLSLITLGVSDVGRARAFHAALGWAEDGDPSLDVAFFQCPGMVVALWDRAKLAEDSGVEDTGGWGGVTLAYNVRADAEVDAVIEEARAAGATIARAGAPTFWGGYSGVFVDPDGHPWEVAHNPRWTVDEAGATSLWPHPETPGNGCDTKLTPSFWTACETVPEAVASTSSGRGHDGLL